MKEKTDPNWTGLRYERKLSLGKTLPRVVFFAGCRDVNIRDVTLTSSPGGWGYWLHDCDRVQVRGLKILVNMEYPNNDGIHMDGIYAHPLRAVISAAKETLVTDVRDIRFSNVHATALELPLVSGRPGNPLKQFSFTDCTLRKVSDAELPGWERHGPAVWERVRKTTFEHVEWFTYTNTRFDAP